MSWLRSEGGRPIRIRTMWITRAESEVTNQFYFNSSSCVRLREGADIQLVVECESILLGPRASRYWAAQSQALVDLESPWTHLWRGKGQGSDWGLNLNRRWSTFGKLGVWVRRYSRTSQTILSNSITSVSQYLHPVPTFKWPSVWPCVIQ